jgi:hypothetical protein
MAASKAKKGKKRTTTGRKSRLWLRDLFNLLTGLLVGSFGFWLIQGYLETRTAKEVSQRYRSAVQGDLPVLRQASERYEALAEDQGDPAEVLQGMDITGALYRLDAYDKVQEDLSDLSAEVRPLLLAFYLNLRDAERLRKLVIEQQEHPEQFAGMLTREFLRTLHEGTRFVPRLLRTLGPNAGSGGAP